MTHVFFLSVNPSPCVFSWISPTLVAENRFRSGSSRVLISTDLWGRGLDVQQAVWSGGRLGPEVGPEVAIVNGLLLLLLLLFFFF